MKKIVRIQSGVRIERRTLKVAKGLAEMLDMSLGELIEGVLLHAFDGQAPFTADTLARVAQLRKVYGLDLTSADAHKLEESAE